MPDEVRPALSDRAPVVIWEERIAERASVVFPRDEGVEVAGVVLDGSVDLTPMDAQKARTVGGRWTAFRAPGAGVTLGGTGGKAARVALVVAVTERGTSLGGHLDQRDRPGASFRWRWRVRKKRVDTFSFKERPDLAWGGGAYHARIGWEPSKYRSGDGGKKGVEVDDQPAMVLDLVRISADAALADDERGWESLALLEGDGAWVRKGTAGDVPVEARPGAVVTFAAGARYVWKPSGKGPLFVLQVYAPPGPEQRFKALAAKAP